MDRSTPDTISDHGTVVFVKPMNVWFCDLEHDLICGPLARKHMVDHREVLIDDGESTRVVRCVALIYRIIDLYLWRTLRVDNISWQNYADAMVGKSNVMLSWGGTSV